MNSIILNYFDKMISPYHKIVNYPSQNLYTLFSLFINKYYIIFLILQNTFLIANIELF